MHKLIQENSMKKQAVIHFRNKNAYLYLVEAGGYGGPGAKISVTQKITHNGEINR